MQTQDIEIWLPFLTLPVLKKLILASKELAWHIMIHRYKLPDHLRWFVAILHSYVYAMFPLLLLDVYEISARLMERPFCDEDLCDPRFIDKIDLTRPVLSPYRIFHVRERPIGQSITCKDLWDFGKFDASSKRESLFYAVRTVTMNIFENIVNREHETPEFVDCSLWKRLFHALPNYPLKIYEKPYYLHAQTMEDHIHRNGKFFKLWDRMIGYFSNEGYSYKEIDQDMMYHFLRPRKVRRIKHVIYTYMTYESATLLSKMKLDDIPWEKAPFHMLYLSVSVITRDLTLFRQDFEMICDRSKKDPRLKMTRIWALILCMFAMTAKKKDNLFFLLDKIPTYFLRRACKDVNWEGKHNFHMFDMECFYWFIHKTGANVPLDFAKQTTLENRWKYFMANEPKSLIDVPHRLTFDNFCFTKFGESRIEFHHLKSHFDLAIFISKHPHSYGICFFWEMIDWFMDNRDKQKLTISYTASKYTAREIEVMEQKRRLEMAELEHVLQVIKQNIEQNHTQCKNWPDICWKPMIRFNNPHLISAYKDKVYHDLISVPKDGVVYEDLVEHGGEILDDFVQYIIRMLQNRKGNIRTFGKTHVEGLQKNAVFLFKTILTKRPQKIFLFERCHFIINIITTYLEYRYLDRLTVKTPLSFFFLTSLVEFLQKFVLIFQESLYQCRNSKEIYQPISTLRI